MKFVKPESNKQSKIDLPPFDLRFFSSLHIDA